jgi:predicted HicB family RNase H-like nuclease
MTRKAEATDRQQVGARVTKATYRQLKAQAALQGVTVQALVETAIDDFLAKSKT